MRKTALIVLALVIAITGGVLGYQKLSLSKEENHTIIGKVEELGNEEENEEEEEGYDGAFLRDQWEYEMVRDPATGKVPYEHLLDAIAYTKAAKSSVTFRTQSVLWQERGPIYDSVGLGGNRRGGSRNLPGTYTSGRIRAILVDASDESGNTVWCGGVAGGLWKCTNFLSSEPDWVQINDFFLNMAISSICQDPSNPDVMYFSTGEPTNNTDAVLGKGIWKSTDHGVTWNQLTSTSSFTQIFKVLCDASGNVYFAARSSGLRRSTNGGATFTAITPSGVLSSCTDVEISSTGRMHAAFGYNTAASSTAAGYRYTDNPATVTAAGWSSGTGLPTATATANRIELAVQGSTVYAVTTNGSNNIYATWQSTDGGATWARQNPTNYTENISNTQGWYDITLEIDPANSSRIIMGGLDLYQSLTGGTTLAAVSSWASASPYVHADQHNTIWYLSGVESRLITACDGGLFYSSNGGLTWSDRNKNLGIKQFYSCAIRPEANSDYILAGAQDNGVHQIKTPGKTYSWEVTGGDGGFVDISQTNPNLQFGSYVYNQYRRSTNGGASWTSVTFSSTIGRFINPFDYDELSDALYASYGTNTLLRWNTPATTSSSTNLTVTGLGTASAITASPYTLGTVYAGSTAGQVFKITDANTAAGPTTSSSISDAAMTGVVSCIAVGTSDNTLVAVMSNYSINNVWYSNNGGVSWSQIDGNLPDMPVRWAVFQPGSDSRLIIATEAGVYTSNIIDGSNTQWSPSPGFPTVRTDMLRVRANDQLLVAATHGRGLWSANVLQVLPVRDLTLKASLQGTGQSQLNWTSSGAIPATRFHIQFSTDGTNFTDVGEVPYNMNRFTHVMTEMAGYYRIVSAEPNSAPVISNTVLVRNNNSRGLQISIAPNPVRSTMTVLLSGGENGNYRWEIVTSAGQVMLRGSGSSQQNTTHSVPVNVASLPSGMYWLRLLQGSKSISESFLKQ